MYKAVTTLCSSQSLIRLFQQLRAAKQKCAPPEDFGLNVGKPKNGRADDPRDPLASSSKKLRHGLYFGT